MCELDTTLCVDLASRVRPLPFFEDFVSSAYYYADVIRYGEVDYLAGHRLCAFFTLYNIGILACGTLLALLLAPSVLMTATEVLLALSTFLVDVQAAENAAE